jgi:hypothetical protein
MFPVLSLFVLLGLTLCILPSLNARAQSSENGVVYEAARNKIGLIRYCRGNALLDPVIAGQAITAVETVLRELPPSESLPAEQGDRAQQAGEDGFWDVGRRRDIASVAKLFHTTPTDLCQEWADETLRAQAPSRRREATTTTAVAPIQPPSQAEPPAEEPAAILRAPVPGRRKEFATATAVAPIQALPQAEPTAEEPTAVLKAPVPTRYMEVKTIIVDPPIQPPSQAEPTVEEPTAVLKTSVPRQYREVKTITVAPPIQSPSQAEPTVEEPTAVLKAPVPRQYREVTTTTAIAPIQLPPQAEPTPQAGPTAEEPLQVDSPPAPATAVVEAARSAPTPPLPEKAPVPPAGAEVASLQRTLPTGGRLASTGRAVSGQTSGTTAIPASVKPRSSGQAVPPPARVATEAAEPRLYDQPQPLLEKRVFNRLGKPERCLMAGCRWPSSRERDASR